MRLASPSMLSLDSVATVRLAAIKLSSDDSSQIRDLTSVYESVTAGLGPAKNEQLLNLMAVTVRLGQRDIHIAIKLVVALLAAALIPSAHALANGSSFNSQSLIEQNKFSAISFPLQVTIPDNPYTDDLVVDHDDTLEGDVFVASGDVVVEEGGEILGSLTVFSGDIDVESGARIDGDVISISGDVVVAGKIGGSLSVVSGDVDFDSSAHVAGDLNVASGDVDDNANNYVGGKLHVGPKFAWSPTPSPTSMKQPQDRSLIGRFLAFILRLIGSSVAVVVIAAGAGLFARSRPEYLASVRSQLHKNKAAHLATGALFNLVLGLLAVIFAITLCLMPMSLVAGGVMLVVNGIGWAAIATSVGSRLTGYTDVPMPSVATVVLGAFALTIPFAFLWALDGGCLRFIGLLSVFVISSIGAGSVLAPWLKRLSSDDDSNGMAPQLGS